MFVFGEHLGPTWGTPCMVCSMQEPWTTNAQGEQSKVSLVLSVLGTVAPLSQDNVLHCGLAVVETTRRVWHEGGSWGVQVH